MADDQPTTANESASNPQQRPNLSGAKAVAKDAKGFFGGQSSAEKKANEDLRKTFANTGRQLSFTQRLLQDNLKSLEELATTNDAVAEALKKQLSEQEFEKLIAINEKIVSGQEVSAKEGQFFTKTLDKFGGAIDSIGVSLEASLQDVVATLGETALDENVGIEDRRKALQELIDVASKNLAENEQDSEALEALKQIQIDQLNFTEDQNDQLRLLLADLGDDTTDIKVAGTLQNLNNQFDSLILTNEELNRTLEGGVEGLDAESIRDALNSGIQSTAGKGLAGFLLSAIGLGGLEELAPAVGGLVGGAGKLATGVFSGIGKLFKGKAGRIVSKGLKGGLKVLGKIAGPIALLFSAFEFIEGFSNAAEIAGLPEGVEPTTGQKIQAGIANALSGLSFGLISAEDIFKKIDEGLAFFAGLGSDLVDFIFDSGLFDRFAAVKDSFMNLFGGEGSFLSRVGDFFGSLLELSPAGLIFDAIKSGFEKLFGEEGMFPQVGEFIQKILEFDFMSLIPESVRNVISGGKEVAGEIADSASELADGAIETGKEAVDSVKSFFGFGDDEQTAQAVAVPEPTTVASPEGQQVPGQAAQGAELGGLVADENARGQAAAAQGQQPIIFQPNITVQAPPAGRPAAGRDTQVDDLGLAMANSGRLE